MFVSNLILVKNGWTRDSYNMECSLLKSGVMTVKLWTLCAKNFHDPTPLSTQYAGVLLKEIVSWSILKTFCFQAGHAPNMNQGYVPIKWIDMMWTDTDRPSKFVNTNMSKHIKERLHVCPVPESCKVFTISKMFMP